MMNMNGTMTLSDGRKVPIDVTEISINTTASEVPVTTMSGRMREVYGGMFEATFEGDWNESPNKEIPKKITNWKKIIEGEKNGM